MSEVIKGGVDLRGLTSPGVITRARPDYETMCRAVCKARGFDPDMSQMGTELMWQSFFIRTQVDTFLALAELCGLFEVRDAAANVVTHEERRRQMTKDERDEFGSGLDDSPE